MPDAKYGAFKALDLFFEVVQKGLREFVDGEHYFDTVSDDALFEFRYNFPGWPQAVQGRANLMALYSGYGNSIKLQRADLIAVHPSKDGSVVVLEYEVHGKALATGVPYDNRFASVVTIKNRKIVLWRDYMDSLAAWMALNSAKEPKSLVSRF